MNNCTCTVEPIRTHARPIGVDGEYPIIRMHRTSSEGCASHND